MPVRPACHLELLPGFRLTSFFSVLVMCLLSRIFSNHGVINAWLELALGFLFELVVTGFGVVLVSQEHDHMVFAYLFSRLPFGVLNESFPDFIPHAVGPTIEFESHRRIEKTCCGSHLRSLAPFRNDRIRSKSNPFNVMVHMNLRHSS